MNIQSAGTDRQAIYLSLQEGRATAQPERARARNDAGKTESAQFHLKLSKRGMYLSRRYFVISGPCFHVFEMYCFGIGMHMLPQDTQILEGSICEHWVQDDGASRIHIYIDRATQG